MPILTKRINKTPLGIYIHIPFCRSKCQYCDFYSQPCKDDRLMDAYLATRSGFLLRATGDNQRYTVMLGKNPGTMKIFASS